MTARAIGTTAGGALLARPDGVPFAVFSSAVDAHRRLRAALADRIPPMRLRDAA
jgi:hypothetical protein